ncbi:MAG: M56 family metallopeptidase [Bacteroides sp.]|nr:M56 family metallopeptidase [Bacteroides sp.]
MTLIQYYLFANAYILVIWFFYRLCLKNLIHFQSLRIYLNVALLLALILPFLQNGISSLLSSSSLIMGASAQNIPALGFIYQYEEVLSQGGAPGFNWQKILGGLILTGSFITTLLYLGKHFRIKSIIKRSKEQSILENGLKVIMSDDVTVPFIYNNKIVLPASISHQEITAVLDHEALHYSYGHRFDNRLFSLFHILFWVNPFYLLLKAALKLNHEYQVDGKMLASGTDPRFYKLSLLKYSVGLQRFSMANGMSSANLKARLLMINGDLLRKGKWRFYLVVPMMILSLALFSMACVQKDVGEDLAELLTSEIPEAESPVDSVRMKFIEVGYDKLPEIMNGEVVVVLMNRSSRIYVAGEKDVLPEDVEGKIISEYNKLLESGSDVSIALQKDVQTDMGDYQKLLDHIATALYKLRNIHAWRIYGSNFDSLPIEDKEVVMDLVPFEIYSSSPKDMGRRSAGSQ